jgi:hypothetical protein
MFCIVFMFYPSKEFVGNARVARHLIDRLKKQVNYSVNPTHVN